MFGADIVIDLAPLVLPSALSLEVSTMIRLRSSYYFADLLNQNFEGLYKVKFLSHTSNLSISSSNISRQPPLSYARVRYATM